MIWTRVCIPALLACFLATGAASTPTEEDEARSVRASALALSWQVELDRIRTLRDSLSADLQIAHSALLTRARAVNPSLVERLSPSPPTPRPQGYRILPEIRSDPGVRKGEPQRRVYSLENLAGQIATSFKDGTALARSIREGVGEPLEHLVDEYERLRAKLRNHEDHIAYHAQWQQAVIDDAEYFAGRNEILTLVREWRALVEHQGDSVLAESLKKEIVDRLAPFDATDGVVISMDPDGVSRLRVTLVTDIEDSEFLQEFIDAVASTIGGAKAAVARRFEVDLKLERIAPVRLYPGGAPERGTVLQERDHLGRFPDGALVLTTGAQRTHAFVGRYIQLGSEPRSRRSLAHEFCHLLGFSDAYLRAFEGSPDDPFGCLLVEWTGLGDDLMSSSDYGEVTNEMLDRLFEAYASGR